MTKEALQELGLTDEQIAKVLELKGKAIAAEQKRADKAEKERDNWKSRAEAAEDTLKGFDGVDVEKLNAEIADWKKKAEEAEAEYKQQMYDRDFADVLKAEMENIKFSSEAAKRSVMADIKEAGLKLKDGKILGLGDLIKQIREKDADAFGADEDGKKPARFTTKKRSSSDKPMSVEDIYKIKDAAERQKAIAENMALFEKE